MRVPSSSCTPCPLFGIWAAGRWLCWSWASTAWHRCRISGLRKNISTKSGKTVRNNTDTAFDATHSNPSNTVYGRKISVFIISTGVTTIAKNISKRAKQTSTRHRPVHTRGRTKQYTKHTNISYIMFITASIMGSSTACRKPSWFWTSASIRNKRTKTAILIPNFLSSCRLLHWVRREAKINRRALEYQRLLFLVWRPLSRSCVIIWKGFVSWVYMPNMKSVSQSYNSKVIVKTSFCHRQDKN